MSNIIKDDVKELMGMASHISESLEEMECIFPATNQPPGLWLEHYAAQRKAKELYEALSELLKLAAVIKIDFDIKNKQSLFRSFKLPKD